MISGAHECHCNGDLNILYYMRIGLFKLLDLFLQVLLFQGRLWKVPLL